MEWALEVQAVQVASFGPLALIADADVSGGQVDDGRRNEKRRDLARPAVQQADVLALDDVEPADAGPDVDARRARRSPA